MIELNPYHRSSLNYNIVQCGTGGTGGYLVQHISQMISIFSVKTRYLIADPDVIEEKNLKNQLFISKDVGSNKADVLARRYSTAYDTKISSYSKAYVEDVETLTSLFIREYETFNGYTLPVLIGAVDNNYTRKVMHEFFEQSNSLLYLDVGNESVTYPSDDPKKDKSLWNEEEKEEYINSGYSGQVVIGLKMNGKVILEPFAVEFPDILEDDDELKPSESCSSIVFSEPQRVLTNKYAALVVSTVLNEIFETNTVTNHIIHFHAKKAYIRAIKA